MAPAWRTEYESGARLEDMAERYELSLQCVARGIKDAGGTIRKRGYGSVPPPYGADNHAWRGGRVMKDGYVMIRLRPSDPWADVATNRLYALEHRLVMSKHLGRVLEPWETVHHINGDKTNNRIENLQLRSGRHGKGVRSQCMDCGSHNVQPVAL